jgi:superfamily II DNA or RNA helicase
MSIKISKKNIDCDIENIYNDCTIKGAPNDYGPSEEIQAYGETNDNIYLPFFYAKKIVKKEKIIFPAFSKTSFEFLSNEYPFRTDGGRDQEQVFNDALGLLKKYNSVLLSLFCGFGKTMLGIRIAQKIGLKVAVLTHRSKLTEQWVESIQKFTKNAKIQIVKGSDPLDPKADFYIFNIAMVSKIWDYKTKSWKQRKLNCYKDIGFVIVDEGHIIGAEKIAESLLYFCPKMVCCLTATPIRKDGMDKILELYFGDYKITRIIRIAQNPFTVYRIPTKIKPEFTLNKKGRKNWGSLINYLTHSEERNKIIINIVEKFPNKIFLILTKLKSHCTILAQMLNKLQIKNTIMIGKDKKYDKTARVLISTFSKLGVGFDDSRLNAAIMAMSINQVEQYAGRLRDEPGKERIIFDLVDDDSNCLEHWRERRKWYISRLGNIKNYKGTDENKGTDEKGSDENKESDDENVKEPTENTNEKPIEKPIRLSRKIPLKQPIEKPIEKPIRLSRKISSK